MKNFVYETTNLELEDFQESIQKKCKWIGEGGYATVFSLPKYRVLKVGQVNADHYIQYLSYVGIRSANVHFPKIFDVKLYDPAPNNPFSQPYYAVEMEELITEDRLMVYLSDALGMRHYMIRAKLDSYWTDRGLSRGLDSLHPCFIDHEVPTTPDLQEVKDTLNALYTAGAGCDIYGRNTMWRYDSRSHAFDAVFTDPVV